MIIYISDFARALLLQMPNRVFLDLVFRQNEQKQSY